MAYEQILYDVSDRIATITLNRPDRMNAMPPKMIGEIHDALQEADRDDHVRVVIVTGAGKAFCSGMDMDVLRTPAAKVMEESRELNRRDEHLKPDFRGAFSYMLALRKPVIGAINGVCVGVGFTCALYFDIRVAAESARMGILYPRRGLSIEEGASWMLPRLIGLADAIELVVTGRTLTAREALERRLVTHVFPDDQLMAKARELATEIATQCSPVGIAVARRMVYEHMLTDLATAIREDFQELNKLFGGADFREGIKAFMQRRPPNFPGR
jgi:enoyl-CoA hydratase/carnithine racemase